MALPNFLQFGKKYSNTDINLAADTKSEVIDASQTSYSSIELGSGATTLTAGDFDFVQAGSGTDFVYSARGDQLATGSGSDTFVFGVGSKPQTAGMIGNCTVGDSEHGGETIEIAKSFFGTTAGQQAMNLAQAISGATMQSDGSIKLTIDNQGDSITFNSGTLPDAKHIKLV